MARLVTTHVISREEKILIERCRSQVQATISCPNPSTTTILCLACCYLESANDYERTLELRRSMRTVLSMNQIVNTHERPLQLLSYPTMCAEPIVRIWTLLNPLEVYCVRDKDIILCSIEYLRRKLYGRSLAQLSSRRLSLARLGRRDARAPPPGFEDMEAEEKQDSGESMC